MTLWYRKFLLKKIQKGENQGKMINNSFLKEAEIKVMKVVQARRFDAEIKSLGLRGCDSDWVSRLKGNSEISKFEIHFWIKMMCIMLETDYASHVWMAAVSTLCTLIYSYLHEASDC